MSSDPNSAPRSMYISEHGPQGPDGPACQKLSAGGSLTMRSSGTPISRQISIASSSGPSPSSSEPSKTDTQISSGAKPKPPGDLSRALKARPPDQSGLEAEAAGRQLPAEAQRLLLEVVADTEVSENFEER